MESTAQRIEPGALPTSETSYWRLPVTLRDYQKEALIAWFRRKKGTVLIPTGGGKTLLAIAAIIESRVSTVIVVPTRILIDQWRKELAAAGIRAAVYYGEEKQFGPVLLTTYQSAYRDPIALRGHTLLIADESDLASADAWGSLLRDVEHHPLALFVSATLPTEKERIRQMDSLVPIVYKIIPSKLIESGHFARVEIIPYFVTLTAEDQIKYEEVQQGLVYVIRKLGTGDPLEVRRLTKSPNPDARSAAFTYFKLITERGVILASTESKDEAVYAIQQLHPGQRILIFGSYIDVLQRTCNYLSVRGVPCRLITSEVGRKARREIISEWGKSFQLLFAISVIERGFNVPEAAVGVIMGGGRGERRLIQRVGRLVRPSPGKEYAAIYLLMNRGTVEEKTYPVLQRLFSQVAEPVEDNGGGAFYVGRRR